MKPGRVMAIALLCTGCAVGPDFHRPAPPAADRYTREPIGSVGAAGDAEVTPQRLVPGAQIRRDWWSVFGSPALDALVEHAFEHSPTLEAAQAALRQAHENTAAQRSAFFPTVQASYSPSRQLNAVGTVSPALASGDALYTLHTAQLTISYAPDVFGLNRRSVESLAAQEDSQRFQLQAAYLTLASNVVSAAIQQASLRAQIAATHEIVEADRRMVALLRRQFELGAASGLDVSAQETALAQAEQTLPPLEKQLEQTRNLLAVLAGRLPAEGGREDFDLHKLGLPRELPLTLPSQLVNRRPDVRAGEAMVHSASAQVGIALANRFPQFSITGAKGGTATEFAQMFASGNQFWSIAGSVTQTIFDFGALRHRQRAAEAALDQAMAQYRGTVLSAFQNVADALYALDSDARALSAAVRFEAAARRTLDLTRGQLDAGAANILALLNAETAFQQARLARVQAEAARLSDTAALVQALGGPWTGESE